MSSDDVSVIAFVVAGFFGWTVCFGAWPLPQIVEWIYRRREEARRRVHPWRPIEITGMGNACGCGHRKNHPIHRVTTVTQQGRIEELEQWHHTWRLAHDKDYREIFGSEDETPRESGIAPWRGIK